MSLHELSKDDEIHRLHTVIDAQLFGPRASAVRDMQVRLRVLADGFELLDRIELPAEARRIIETCKTKLSVLEAADG